MRMDVPNNINNLYVVSSWLFVLRTFVCAQATSLVVLDASIRLTTMIQHSST